MIDLNEENFKSLVTDSKEIWILNFTATWCGPCKILKPEVAKAAKNLKDAPVHFGTIDCSDNKNLAKQF